MADYTILSASTGFARWADVIPNAGIGTFSTVLVGTPTGTEFAVQNTDGTVSVFEGTGITYGTASDAAAPDTGVITSAARYSDASRTTLLAEVENLDSLLDGPRAPFSSSAFSIGFAINTGNSPSLFLVLLGEDDSVVNQSSNGELLEGWIGNDTITGGAAGETLDGGFGDDILQPGLGSDVLFGGDKVGVRPIDSYNRTEGTPAELDGDTFGDFDLSDVVRVEGLRFGSDALSVTPTGDDAVLGIDTDGVGGVDTTLTFTGLAGASFEAVASDPGDPAFTDIAVFREPTLPTIGIARNLILTPQPFVPVIPITLVREGDMRGESSVTWSIVPDGANPVDASDFVGGVLPSGTATFPPGTSTIEVLAEITATPPNPPGEMDETFRVVLSDPVGATLRDSQDEGIIFGNDPLGDLIERSVTLPITVVEERDFATESRTVAERLILPDGCGEIVLTLNQDGTTSVAATIDGDALNGSASDLLGMLPDGATQPPIPPGVMPPAGPGTTVLGRSAQKVLVSSETTSETATNLSSSEDTIFIGDSNDPSSIIVITGRVVITTVTQETETRSLLELTVEDQAVAREISIEDAIALLGNDPDLAEIVAALEAKLEPENEPPVAEDDAFMVLADGTLEGENLLDDNGNGADSDPEGDPLTVTALNDDDGNLGNEIELPSGALVTLNDNGSFDYDPNGAFDDLLVGDSETDSFTYTIDDGNSGTDTATATVTVKGVLPPPASEPSIELSKSVKVLDYGHGWGHQGGYGIRNHWGKGGWRHKAAGDKAKALYTVQVRNTSDDPADAELTLASIIDDNGTPGVLGDDFDLLHLYCAFRGGDSDRDGLLDVGEVWTFQYRQRIDFDGRDAVTNTAEATARNGAGQIAIASDDATVPAPVHHGHGGPSFEPHPYWGYRPRHGWRRSGDNDDWGHGRGWGRHDDSERSERLSLDDILSDGRDLALPGPDEETGTAAAPGAGGWFAALAVAAGIIGTALETYEGRPDEADDLAISA